MFLFLRFSNHSTRLFINKVGSLHFNALFSLWNLCSWKKFDFWLCSISQILISLLMFNVSELCRITQFESTRSDYFIEIKHQFQQSPYFRCTLFFYQCFYCLWLVFVYCIFVVLRIFGIVLCKECLILYIFHKQLATYSFG